MEYRYNFLANGDIVSLASEAYVGRVSSTGDLYVEVGNEEEILAEMRSQYEDPESSWRPEDWPIDFKRALGIE